MSPWSRNRLQVVLQPERVALSRVAHPWTWRGRRGEAITQQWLSCAAGAKDAPWQPALAALSETLPAYAGERLAATLILSNRFVRYALVPWSADLDETEEMALARHCFTRIHGEAAETWQIRLSPGPAGAPRLASALDPELLDAARAAFAGFGIELKSIQPYLMTAFNDFGPRRRGLSAWFAMVEPGNLCLALLLDGRWTRVRCLRIGADWREELVLALRREMIVADVAATPDEVYLWRRDADATALPGQGDWSVHSYTYRSFGVVAPDPAPVPVPVE